MEYHRASIRAHLDPLGAGRSRATYRKKGSRNNAEHYGQHGGLGSCLCNAVEEGQHSSVAPMNFKK